MAEYSPLPPLLERVYVGSKLICQRPAIWLRLHDTGKPGLHPGISFFCPECNEIWARRIVECTQPNHPEIGKCFLPQVHTRPCERHGDGSLLIGIEWEQALEPSDYYGYYYPIEILAYELFLIVRRFA